MINFGPPLVDARLDRELCEPIVAVAKLAGRAGGGGCKIRKHLRGHRINPARRDDVGLARDRQAGYGIESKCVAQNGAASTVVYESGAKIRIVVNSARQD